MVEMPAAIGPAIQKEEASVERVRPSVWAALMAAWFMGIGLCSTRLLRGLWRMRRIVAAATEVEDARVSVFANTATRLFGLRQVPRILTTDEKISPFVFGVLRPLVVLPRELVNKSAGKALSAVIAHELAHLRRRDPFVGWILAFCEAVYFFNPAFYFAKRRILLEREKACDEWVIAISRTGRRVYVKALADAAGICHGLGGRVAPASVVAESFSDLKKRLVSIGANIKPRAKLSVHAMVLLVLIGIICAPGIVLTAREARESGLSTTEAVSEPAAVATVEDSSETNRGGGAMMNAEAWADVNQKAVVEGRVTDPDGRPIANATVQIRKTMDEMVLEATPEGVQMRLFGPDLETDRQGYYVCDEIAERWEYCVGAVWQEDLPDERGMRHQYLRNNKFYSGGQTINFQFKQFPEGNSALSGQVVEPNGQAIREFTIELRRKVDGEDYSGEYLHEFGYRIPVSSDDGRFEMGGLPDGAYTVLAQPKNEVAYDYWTWHDCNVGQTTDAELKIEITKKKAFYGRVLFEDGSPAVVKPELYAGAKTRVREEGLALLFPGFAELGKDGYFTMWLAEESIGKLEAGETWLAITVPITHPHVERGAIQQVGKFPFEVLSEDKDRPGVVRLDRQAGGYASAKAEAETGRPERATESSVTTRTWTARELIEKIIESEKKIRSWEVRAEYTAYTGFRVVRDMGYEGRTGRKYDEGTEFSPARREKAPPPYRNNPEYGPDGLAESVAYTSEYRSVFDGTRYYRLADDICFPFREGKWLVEYTGKEGSVRCGSRSVTGGSLCPHDLLGNWVNGLFRGREDDTLGEVLLRHIRHVRVREVPENINGHLCTVMEVLGIRDYVPEGISAVDDLHIWIDTERDFRPLRIETHRFREQYEGRVLTGMRKELQSTLETTKLTKIDGIWFPTLGESWSGTDRDDHWCMSRIGQSSIRLNKRIDPEEFAPIEFPPGCKVSDWIRDVSYIVGEFSDPAYEPETPLEKVLKQLRDGEVEVDPEFTGDLVSILRDVRMGPNKGKWMAAVRGLVLIGSPAVPELTAELKRTLREKPKTDREMIRHGKRQSALTFTLRAIGDLSVVPALINALARSGACSDYGLGKPKTDLDRFFRRHQIDPSEAKLGFGRPVREITAALERMTGHTEGHYHICAHDIHGRPIPCYALSYTKPQLTESSQTVARRWRRWWQMNRDRVLGQSGPPVARHRRSNDRHRAR
jgi:beta-lactamase regulating signal transducer with metallopeptidase domain